MYDRIKDSFDCVYHGSEGDLWPVSAVSLCPGVFFIHLEAGRQPGCPATQLQHKPVQGWNNRGRKTENMVSTVRNKKMTTSNRTYQLKPVPGLLLAWDQIISNLHWYILTITVIQTATLSCYMLAYYPFFAGILNFTNLLKEWVHSF